MSAIKGRLFLLAISNDDSVPGPETFITVAGLRKTDWTKNNTQVDVSNKDSSGWKTLLEGAGEMSMSLSGDGVVESAGAAAKLQLAYDGNLIKKYKISIDGTSTYTGLFAITKFSEAGTYNGEVTYTISLESSGPVTYTA